MMNRQNIIERTVNALNRLPDDRVKEISDFIDYILKQYEGQVLTEGIVQITADSRAFDFLKDDEELYSEVDIKEPYNG